MTKKCSKCGEVKDVSCFSKRASAADGYRASCKDCKKEYNKKYREENSESLKKYDRERASMPKRVEARKNYKKNNLDVRREYYRKNKEKIELLRKKRYAECNIKINKRRRQSRIANKDKINQYKRELYANLPQDRKSELVKKGYEYYHNNIEKRRPAINAYTKKRRATDPNYKIMQALRSRVGTAIKCQYGEKSKKTTDLVGCSVDALIAYLSVGFYARENGEVMNLDNYGMHGWHIDHKIPCASFDLTDPEQQKLCFHYTNLQPLWAEDNLSKSDKLDWHKEVN